MRRRGFESHPVLLRSLTIRPAIRRAHDVAVACCSARADVRVQLPLGALKPISVWASLELRVLREHEIGGSNPSAPTFSRVWRSLASRKLGELERPTLRVGARVSNPATLTLLRWGLCWYRQAAVNRPFTGSIPVAAALINGRTSRTNGHPARRCPRWQLSRKQSSDKP